MDAAEYKHVVLGVIFLKYISDAFKEVARANIFFRVRSTLRICPIHPRMETSMCFFSRSFVFSSFITCGNIQYLRFDVL